MTPAQKRWKQNNRAAVLRQKKRNYAQTQGGPNTRKRWTEAELAKVAAHEVPDRELAAELGRSVQAIQVVRSKALCVGSDRKWVQAWLSSGS